MSGSLIYLLIITIIKTATKIRVIDKPKKNRAQIKRPLRQVPIIFKLALHKMEVDHN
jgi:hypothetical protein